MSRSKHWEGHTAGQGSASSLGQGFHEIVLSYFQRALAASVTSGRGDSENCINTQEPQVINKSFPCPGSSRTFRLLWCITGPYRSMPSCPCCGMGDTYCFRVDSWSHFAFPSASNRWRSSCVDRVKPTMEQRASATQNMRKEKKSSLFHTV